MGRALSPVIRTELENLDKGADCRKSAMKTLTSYMKDLDSKAIPMFLAQVSDTKQTGQSTGEHAISLYEVLARVHGPKIVPQISNIMSIIVKTLSSSGGAFALHQACSKVVPAISRYAMDPTTAKETKRFVIHSICKPLSDCLLGSQENLSSGAAMCLQALVESDNWRFASNEIVNDVCQRVAGALEKHTQTNSHMALVTALAKHNSMIVEAYARLLIQSGLKILDAGYAEANSQKQLTSIHMLSSLMRCLEPKSIISEIEMVITEMEKCQYDRMPFVTGAAFEALQIAKRISAEKGSKAERYIGSATGSNFDRRENGRKKSMSSSGDQSPLTASPESQTVESSFGYNHFNESPMSTNKVCRGMGYDCRSVNRKLWQRSENGGVDVSLKDGIFSEMTRGSDFGGSDYDGFSDNNGDHLQDFSGFVHGRVRNGSRSNTPSPQRTNSRFTAEDLRIFTTPRKLMHSLQDSDESNGSFSPVRRFRSPTPSKFMFTPTSKNGGGCQGTNCNSISDVNFSSGDEQVQGSSESVSSNNDVADMVMQANLKEIPNRSQLTSSSIRKNSATKIVFGLFVVLFAVLLCLMSNGDQDGHGIPVPT